MRARSVAASGGVTAAAAVVGNLFVGREALAWFRSLRAPRGQLPMPGFVGVATAYYLIMGYVLARAVDRRDPAAIGWAVTVLVSNEAWNGLLFGLRSPRAAFAGVLAFLVPLTTLQRLVWSDKRSRWVLMPYTAYVTLYDVAWAYRLWRLNTSSSPEAPRSMAPDLSSRSAALWHAVRRLRRPQLERDYEDASAEWAGSGDSQGWDATSTDGLPDSAW